MTLTPEDIARLKSLMEKATDAPWYTSPNDHPEIARATGGGGVLCGSYHDANVGTANVDLAVALRNAAPSLLAAESRATQAAARVMELEAEVERAKTVIENYELDYERVVVRQEKCGHELNEDRILDLTTRLAAAETRYHELIMSVGNKYHDETRHQTALRYIQQAEKSSDGPARDTIAQIGGNNG